MPKIGLKAKEILKTDFVIEASIVINLSPALIFTTKEAGVGF